MRFVVRHVQALSGHVVQEVVEAASTDQAVSQVGSGGAVILNVRAVRPFGGGLLARPRRLDVTWWCRELQTLLRAGMTVVEAIETMAAGQHGARQGEAHGRLLTSLHAGRPLSIAMKEAGDFPAVLVASVAASERTSTLAEALSDYLKHDELLERLRRQAASAAMYPSVVICLGGGVALFLLLYVVPKFSRMYGDLQHEVSPATRAVLWVSEAMTQSAPLLLLTTACLVAGCVLAWRSGHLRRWTFRILESSLLKQPTREFRRAKLFQSLSLLFRGGYPVDEALSICSDLELGEQIKTSLPAVREQIAQGKPVSDAMSTAGLTDRTTERLLHVGERAGGFADVLQTIANRHAAAFASYVERSTRIVEPLLLLAVAVLVGSLIVMMYMPIFDMAGGLGGSP